MRIIAGEARGRKLVSPRDASVRPPLDRMRGSIFQVLEGTFEGRAVLDLYAGTGSMGLEAVSRGARRATFVENAESSLRILRKNIERTGFLSRCEVLRGDALWVPDLAGVAPFALVFLDPPFRCFSEEGGPERILSRVRAIIESDALERGGNVMLRYPAEHRGPISLPVAESRTYGESVVLRFEKPPSEV